jgi:hypothetical protein
LDQKSTVAQGFSSAGTSHQHAIVDTGLLSSSAIDNIAAETQIIMPRGI